jgi:hypothetical protein
VSRGAAVNRRRSENSDIQTFSQRVGGSIPAAITN